MTATHPYPASDTSNSPVPVPTPPARIMIGRVGFVAGLFLILLLGKVNMMFTLGEGGSLSDYALIFMICLGLPAVILSGMTAWSVARVYWQVLTSKKESPANEIVADANVIWLLEPWVGWIYVAENYQVGVIDGRVYKKSGWFFVNGTKPSLKKVVSTRVIQIVDREIMVRTIDYPQVKITFSANCVIKPEKAAEVLGTYTTEEQIRTEVISVLSTFIQSKPKSYISVQKADFQMRLAEEFVEKIPYLKVKVLRATDYSEHEVLVEAEVIKARLQIKNALQQKFIEVYIDDIRREAISAGRDPRRAVSRAVAEIESMGVETFIQQIEYSRPGESDRRELFPMPPSNEFENNLVKAVALSEFRLAQSKPPYTLTYLGYRVTISPLALVPDAVEVVLYDRNNRKSKPVRYNQDDLNTLLVELRGVIQSLNNREG